MNFQENVKSKKLLFLFVFLMLISFTIKFHLVEQKEAETDKFGIRKIYSTAGREWFSKWDNGYSRSWNSSSNDPFDLEFITQYKGAGSWKTDGNGVLQITGTNFGSEESCKTNVSSYIPLSNVDNRIGSESKKANLAVYFRTDNVGNSGLLYKKASIQKINYNINKIL